MNWEYSSVLLWTWRVLNCWKTVMSTRAMTSQIATFFTRLFKRCSCWGHVRAMTRAKANILNLKPAGYGPGPAPTNAASPDCAA
jgi:hypothetical protein